MARPRSNPTEKADAFVADYVTVAERIQKFKDDHPNYTIEDVVDPYVVNVAGMEMWIVGKRAIPDARSPDRFATGWAQERVPGLTSFTRNSELQNAETAAVGRAIAFLGYATKGVATREEIDVRDRENALAGDGGPPTQEQRDRFAELVEGIEEHEPNWYADTFLPWLETNRIPPLEELDRGRWSDLIRNAERKLDRLQADAKEEPAEETAKDES